VAVVVMVLRDRRVTSAHGGVGLVEVEHRKLQLHVQVAVRNFSCLLQSKLTHVAAAHTLTCMLLLLCLRLR
jgi:hypothetical protein